MIEIELLDRSVADLRLKANKEKMEMDEIENQMRMLESKYNIKKIQVTQMKAKLDEKMKIASEARKAYSKVYHISNIL